MVPALAPVAQMDVKDRIRNARALYRGYVFKDE